MKTIRDLSLHKTARSLFAVRIALSAVRGALALDDVIAHALPQQPISDTEYWDDALTVGKAHAQKLLRDAHIAVLEAMGRVGPRNELELGTIVVLVKENIDWAWRCLNMSGAEPNNYDRMAALEAVETAWQLSGTATQRFRTINPKPLVAEAHHEHNH